MASRKRRHLAAYLLRVKQQDGESLKSYLSQFNHKNMTTDDQDEKITLATLLGGIWPRNPFMAEIARRTPTTLREFMNQANRFINAEDTLEVLTTPRWSVIEQVDQKPAGQRGHSREGKKGGTRCEEKGRSPSPTTRGTLCSLEFGSGRGARIGPTGGVRP